jgi:hypothetical protein
MSDVYSKLKWKTSIKYYVLLKKDPFFHEEIQNEFQS